MTTATFTNIVAIRLPGNILPEPRPQPSILPREPPGQAMGVSRGSCLGRALRRSHMLLPASPKLSHVHPYGRGPPAYEVMLPDMKKQSQHHSVAVVLVPSEPLGFAARY